MQTAALPKITFGAVVRSSWRASRAQGWVLLPLRLLFGCAFLYSGWHKLTNPAFLNPHAKGYFGHFVPFLAKGSPISGFLLHVVAPHAQLFGALVAYGEFAVGLGILTSVLFRPAAFFGLFLNLMYYLSVGLHTPLWYTSIDLVYMFGWLTLLLAGAGGVALTLDPWLARALLARISRRRQARVARMLDIVLGVPLAALAPEARTAAPSPAPKPAGTSDAKNAVTGTAKNRVATPAKSASTTNAMPSAKKPADAGAPKSRPIASRPITRANATPSRRG
jgi:uncharacterized membrane protein YphA (DoxX/SURF4 family)